MLIYFNRHTMPQAEYITTDEALVILKCSRSYFYRAYIDKLTLYKDDNNFRNYYDKKEVKKLKKSKLKKPNNIKIIRNAKSKSTNIS